MRHITTEAWRGAPQKRIALFGMSGLGKTHVSRMLRASGQWFHYSVDYRIGTRYMDEHIVDNFKREAMRTPFLRDLLMSDSIYIASNITFENLSPLSTYLGKPGNPAFGGIPFEEYVLRQRQHREAEVSATLDTLPFAEKAKAIYGYPHFVCDTSGSLCEVVDPHDSKDPVLSALSGQILLVWIKSTRAHADHLAARFDQDPKPMYYREDFLRAIWGQYLAENDLTEDLVNPDDFIRWGFRRLLEHRQAQYEAMAQNWGISVTAEDIGQVRTADDFENMIARALAVS